MARFVLAPRRRVFAALPSEVQPADGRMGSAVRGVGLLILCVAAIFFGRYLKTLLR